MERIRLPFPVVILALTGALALFSALAGRTPRAAATEPASQRVQAVEQQPAALTYFRIMNWLLRLLPNDRNKVDAAPGAAPCTRSMNGKGRGFTPEVQLCALHIRANSSTRGRASRPAARSLLSLVSSQN